MKEKGSLTPRTLVFAAQKESDESESGSSQSCIEDQMHMAPEYNDGSRDPDVEVASITHSEADLSQSAVQLETKGTFLTTKGCSLAYIGNGTMECFPN
ncbi:hypothetical protein CK203_101358 [Vitis vinifera]|uniref:Uncharacterized protein n=1 Tax=Vitis vinifera TaxID=29760 RepID=A0A438CU41_VITVI|nr:hypothetical protein CK203_101358 [Vitis vinifera]